MVIKVGYLQSYKCSKRTKNQNIPPIAPIRTRRAAPLAMPTIVPALAPATAASDDASSGGTEKRCVTIQFSNTIQVVSVAFFWANAYLTHVLRTANIQPNSPSQ